MGPRDGDDESGDWKRAAGGHEVGKERLMGERYLLAGMGVAAGSGDRRGRPYGSGEIGTEHQRYVAAGSGVAAGRGGSMGRARVESGRNPRWFS